MTTICILLILIGVFGAGIVYLWPKVFPPPPGTPATDPIFLWIHFFLGIGGIGLLFLVLSKFAGLWNQFSGSDWVFVVILIILIMIALACFPKVKAPWIQRILAFLLVICLIVAFGFIDAKRIGGIVGPDGERYADKIVISVPSIGRVESPRQIPKGMAPAYAMENGKVNVYSDGKKIGWVDSYRHWFDPNFEGDANREFESADGKPTTVIMWLYYIKK